MSTLFGFVVGYVVGARGGSASWGRVEQALRDIRQSDEFHNLVDVLKDHVRGTVSVVNDRLAAEDGSAMADLEQLAARARARVTGQH